MPYPYVVARGDARLNGAIIEVSPEGRAVSIERVNVVDDAWPPAEGEE
jgi:calcineurin-like phosphoesterase